jgi:drug/metabolite transporter (DMT)-like permease
VFAVVLALGASASWGSADFLGGFATRRLPVLTVSFVSLLVGLAFVLGLRAFGGDPIPSERTVVLGLIGGCVGAIGLVTLYAALAIGPMGVVAPMVSLSVTVPVAYGLLTGERPAVAQLVGVLFAVGGVLLAARHEDEAGARISGRAVVLALVAAAGLGTLALLLSRAGETDAVGAVMMARLSSIALLGVAVLVRRPSFTTTPRDRLTLAAIGILDCSANLLFTLASQRGLLTLVAVLASLYPVVTVLLARGVLRERLSRVQVGGVALALCGVALIAAG